MNPQKNNLFLDESNKCGIFFSSLSEQRKNVFFLADKYHALQKRKYTGHPYIYHPLSVARIACQYEPMAFEVAICHDVFEDTKVTFEQLHDDFLNLGYDSETATQICVGVMQLTDAYTHEKFPKLNREKRKELEAKRLSKIDPLMQSIKYADFIDNISSIVEYDKEFAKTYLQEKIKILDVMRGGNINLLIEACYVLKQSLLKLEML